MTGPENYKVQLITDPEERNVQKSDNTLDGAIQEKKHDHLESQEIADTFLQNGWSPSALLDTPPTFINELWLMVTPCDWAKEGYRIFLKR